MWHNGNTSRNNLFRVAGMQVFAGKSAQYSAPIFPKKRDFPENSGE